MLTNAVEGLGQRGKVLGDLDLGVRCSATESLPNLSKRPTALCSCYVKTVHILMKPDQVSVSFQSELSRVTASYRSKLTAVQSDCLI